MEKQFQRYVGSPQKFTDTLLAESYRRGKEPLEKIRETETGTHTPENGPISTHWTENFMMCRAWALGTVIQQSLALSDAVSLEE